MNTSKQNGIKFPNEIYFGVQEVGAHWQMMKTKEKVKILLAKNMNVFNFLLDSKL